MMEERLWITADFSPGCDIRDAARLSIDLAKRLRVGVKFSFNGARLYVIERSTVDGIRRDYCKQAGIDPEGRP